MPRQLDRLCGQVQLNGTTISIVKEWLVRHRINGCNITPCLGKCSNGNGDGGEMACRFRMARTSSTNEGVGRSLSKSRASTWDCLGFDMVKKCKATKEASVSRPGLPPMEILPALSSFLCAANNWNQSRELAGPGQSRGGPVSTLLCLAITPSRLRSALASPRRGLCQNSPILHFGLKLCCLSF